MRATEILSQEHRVIEQVLNCLEKMAAASRDFGRCEWDDAQQALEFLRTFADHCHHAKEEDELFPLMEARGFSTVAGPTAVMRWEHDQSRRLMGEMIHAIAQKAPHDLARAASAYIDLIRAHIQKEDNCLFPMADRALSSSDQERLLEKFDLTERKPELIGQHERFLAIADSLAEKYGICTGHSAACAGVCGCKHD